MKSIKRYFQIHDLGRISTIMNLILLVSKIVLALLITASGKSIPITKPFSNP
jgi:hypothetical protein